MNAEASTLPATGGHTTGSIAAAVGGRLDGPSDVVITNLAGLEQATEHSLTFIRSAKFANMWPHSRAAAALITRDVSAPQHDASRRALIVVDNADLAMVKVLEKFAPPSHAPVPGVHPRAIVDPSARLGRGVSIGPNTVIGPETEIGDGTVVHANAAIGAWVKVGPQCTLHAGVIMYDRCSIGAQTILHAGVIIGADGFGYVPDLQGRSLLKVPHIGTVEIGSRVEIGAGSCVDRGKFGATVIGDGTKIDNLVQVGHNVRIGRSVIICGMTGVGGSVTIEDGVMIAGHVGVADGLKIGRGARISAKSGVLSDVPAGATFFGTPASDHKSQMRSFVALRDLPDHLRELRRAARKNKNP